MGQRTRLVTFEDVFTRWAEKAPVRHNTSQRTATRLYRDVVEERLTVEERSMVAIALGITLDEEGRGEFDQVVKGIRDRLFSRKKA